MFKIESVPGTEGSEIRLIGHPLSEHVGLIAAQIRGAAPPIVIDLREVTLIHRDVISFLLACEIEGHSLVSCSAFIRACIDQERTAR